MSSSFGPIKRAIFYTGSGLLKLAIGEKGWGQIRQHFNRLFGGDSRSPSKNTHQLAQEFRSWVFICITLIASRISELKWEIRRDDADRAISVDKDGKAASVIQKVFKRPNRLMSWSGLIYYLVSQMDLYGDCFTYIIRNNLGVPIELWPLDRNWLRETKVGDRLIDGVEYYVFDGLGKVDPNDVIHIRHMNPEPRSMWKGKPIPEAIFATLDHDHYMKRYLTRFFEKDARPSLFLSYKGRLTSTKQREVIEAWEEKLAGNPFLPTIMDQGGQVVTVDPDIKRLATPELSKDIRNTVLAAYRIPLTALGLSEDVNRAAATTISAEFNSNAIAPRCRIISDAFTMFLRDEFDPKDEFGLCLRFLDVIPKDLEQELNFYKAIRLDITLEERRNLIKEIKPTMKLRKLEGPGVYTVMGDVLHDFPIAIATDINAPESVNALPVNIDKEMLQIEHKLEKGTYPEDAYYIVKAKKQRIIKDRFIEEEAKRWNATQTEYWKRQMNLIIGRLRVVGAAKARIDIAKESKLWVDKHLNLEKRSLVFGVVAQLSELGLYLNEDKSVDNKQNEAEILVDLNGILRDPQFSSNLSAQVEESASLIVRSQAKDLIETLTIGLDAGESLTELISRVEEVYGPLFEGWKAERIARTEISAAMELGRYNGLNYGKKVGVVKNHKWLATNDGRTRDTHKLANGQVREIGTPFNVGGHLMKHPLDRSLGAPPEEIVRCRCVTVAEFNG